MITKKQWNKYCWDVYSAKTYFKTCYLNGRRIIEVDRVNNTILTESDTYETRIRYKFPESVQSYNNLSQLYSAVTFMATLHDMGGSVVDLA